VKRAQIILTLVLFMLLSYTGVAGAQETRSVDTILNQIRTEQGISDTSQINPDRVSQAVLIELGDVLSESMMGSDAHIRMENMMGGEGSDSLNTMYARMGRNYLVNYPYSGPYSPMHYGMMGYFGWAGMMVMGFIMVAVVIILVMVFRRYSNKSGFTETPMDILNKRYANGEITKDEFDKIKKELEK